MDSSPFRNKNLKIDILSSLGTGKRVRSLPLLPTPPREFEVEKEVKSTPENPLIINFQKLCQLDELQSSSSSILLDIETRLLKIPKEIQEDGFDEMSTLFKHIQSLLQKNYSNSVPRSTRNENNPILLYNKLCLQCIQFALDRIHSNPTQPLFFLCFKVMS